MSITISNLNIAFFSIKIKRGASDGTIGCIWYSKNAQITRYFIDSAYIEVSEYKRMYGAFFGATS